MSSIAPPAARRRPPNSSGGYSGGWDTPYQRRPPAYAGPGDTGGYGAGGNGFGSAAFWALLGALSAADRSAYFRQYQADPAYQQWHQQALRNPDASARLGALGDPYAQAQSGAAASMPARQGGWASCGW